MSLSIKEFLERSATLHDKAVPQLKAARVLEGLLSQAFGAGNIYHPLTPGSLGEAAQSALQHLYDNELSGYCQNCGHGEWREYETDDGIVKRCQVCAHQQPAQELDAFSTYDRVQIGKVCSRMRELLQDGYVVGADARDGVGQDCPPESLFAKAWSIQGALAKACLVEGQTSFLMAIYRILLGVAQKRYGWHRASSLRALNDHASTTHQDVLLVLDDVLTQAGAHRKVA